MNNLVKLHCIYLVFILIILHSCKKEVLPTLTTATVTNITATTVTSGGSITSDGGSGVTERGVCWSRIPKPTIGENFSLDGKGTGSFTSYIKCLSEGTTYYVRAYATNSNGTAYGGQQVFTTIQDLTPITFNSDLNYGTVSDIDGNCYKTIQIADQEWMAENLKTSRYNDGTPIPNVTDPDEWINLLSRSFDPSTHEPIYEISGAFCWYNNDSATYDNDYGKLYNFGAAESGKLCPSGWHVPAIEEWNTLCYPYRNIEAPSEPLFDKLGIELMEIGTNHWIEAFGTNETGFTALPGGRRSYDSFTQIGQTGYNWSSNRIGIVYGARGLFYLIPFYPDFPPSPLSSGQPMTNGLSIRCIKD